MESHQRGTSFGSNLKIYNAGLNRSALRRRERQFKFICAGRVICVICEICG
jgi:hypothetical protein